MIIIRHESAKQRGLRGQRECRGIVGSMGETKMAWVEILVWVTWVDEVLASMKFWRVLKFWCRLQGSMKYYHGSKKKFFTSVLFRYM